MMRTEMCWKCPNCARTRDLDIEEKLVMVVCPGCLVEMIPDDRIVYDEVKKKKLIFLRVPGGDFVVDEEGEKYFNEVFWKERKKEEKKESNEKKPLYMQEHKQTKIEEYTEYKKITENRGEEGYILSVEQGYLCKIEKKTYNIIWFHRELMKREIEDFAKKTGLPPSLIEVHHLNRKRFDNRKTNLQVIDKRAHEELHRAWNQDDRISNAFETWSTKKFGCVSYDEQDYDEFMEWLERKKEEDCDDYY
jgi:hypothetical protein